MGLEPGLGGGWGSSPACPTAGFVPACSRLGVLAESPKSAVVVATYDQVKKNCMRNFKIRMKEGNVWVIVAEGDVKI